MFFTLQNVIAKTKTWDEEITKITKNKKYFLFYISISVLLIKWKKFLYILNMYICNSKFVLGYMKLTKHLYKSVYIVLLILLALIKMLISRNCSIYIYIFIRLIIIALCMLSWVLIRKYDTEILLIYFNIPPFTQWKCVGALQESSYCFACNNLKIHDA